MPIQTPITIESSVDSLPLSCLLVEPDGQPRGIVQFSHGMAEHKERYLPFMTMLAKQGLVCLIHDHRGHGASVRSVDDLGYFYDATATAVVQDLFQLTQYLHDRYPGLPLTLFAHSMGTLVARVYLQAHDDAIDRLVLCGAPGANPAAGFGIAIAKLISKMKGDHYRSPFIQKLVFGSYASYIANAKSPNDWLSANQDNVRAYEADPLCGYTFTCNGFINLFTLCQKCFAKTGWQLKHPNLPIHMIAGDHDPVIGGIRAWEASRNFLMTQGYTNISSKLYKDLRHELLNEKKADIIMRDVAEFIFSERG